MRKIVLIVLLLTTIILVPSTSVSAVFRVNYDEKTTEFYDGVRHTRVTGMIEYDGVESKQTINYLGANPSKFSDINVVVGDNYLNYSFGKGDLHTIIDNINTRYDNYSVIGGVNGDFYGANGFPVEAYVRNFEVLSMGVGVNRTVIGFKDNGEVVFGRPCFTGYEAIVYNEDGNVKHTLSIEGINQYPTISGNVTVFFEDYPLLVTGAYNKVLLGALETKLDEYQRTYFGKGILQSQTTGDIEVTAQKLLLVGETLNSDNLITEQDTVVVQQHMGCEFEGVRFAIGAWEELVKDGVATEYYSEGAGPKFRHPRTAIGVKEDGTVFFVVVDGRDYTNAILGMTAYELAETMLYFGAVQAYNLDGGGSSAMTVKNNEGEYIYLNTPSDGSPRPVSNGLFFVRGEHKELPVTLPYPDTREILPIPTPFSVSNQGLLTFSTISNASSYDILVDDQLYTTVNPELQINLQPGIHFIKIKANGDYTSFKDSEFSPVIVYTVFTDDLKDILNLLKKYTQQTP